MQERAGLIGGVLQINAAPGRGTRVVLTVPVKEDA
jgi:signal transduction histidine kinase